MNIHFVDVDYKLYPIQSAEPPFDMRKAVYDASSIGGNIYVHPLLFSSVYRYITENIDKPYSVDGSAYYMIGALNIIVTDLIPENEYRVLTELDFIKQYTPNLG
jgi:hypothetical protein